MSEGILISDAAKEVNVENHVLRYWEEELHLPIKRNELGHRYYTKEDIERFRQIKSMKERGLQLKAIKMILKNGKIDILSERECDTANIENAKEEKNENKESKEDTSKVGMAIEIVDKQDVETAVAEDGREEKSRRLQWLLQQLIRETLQENNQQLCRDIKESVVKELDYQFRVQEEREEARDRIQTERNEAYYKKMDDLLRQKREKKKRHFKF